jgi:hypothetical protein
MANQFAVWFFRRHPDGGVVVYDADGSVQEQLAAGEYVGEPSLVIAEDALKALVASASDHLPPSSAIERHLEVRDRLLTLVEGREGEQS